MVWSRIADGLASECSGLETCSLMIAVGPGPSPFQDLGYSFHFKLDEPEPEITLKDGRPLPPHNTEGGHCLFWNKTLDINQN